MSRYPHVSFNQIKNSTMHANKTAQQNIKLSHINEQQNKIKILYIKSSL